MLSQPAMLYRKLNSYPPGIEGWLREPQLHSATTLVAFPGAGHHAIRIDREAVKREIATKLPRLYRHVKRIWHSEGHISIFAPGFEWVRDVAWPLGPKDCTSHFAGLRVDKQRGAIAYWMDWSLWLIQGPDCQFVASYPRDHIVEFWHGPRTSETERDILEWCTTVVARFERNNASHPRLNCIRAVEVVDECTTVVAMGQNCKFQKLRSWKNRHYADKDKLPKGVRKMLAPCSKKTLHKLRRRTLRALPRPPEKPRAPSVSSSRNPPASESPSRPPWEPPKQENEAVPPRSSTPTARPPNPNTRGSPVRPEPSNSRPSSPPAEPPSGRPIWAESDAGGSPNSRPATPPEHRSGRPIWAESDVEAVAGSVSEPPPPRSRPIWA